MASIGDIIGALGGMDVNPRVIRELGAELARGMQAGGNARSFSPSNPSGQDTSAGVAGGRGDSGSSRVGNRSEADYIRSEQLKVEVNRKVFSSYKRLNKQLDSTSKGLDDVQGDISVFAKAFSHSWDDAMDRVNSSSRVQANLIANLNELGFENIKTTEDLLDLREKHLKLEKKLLHAKGIERLALLEEHKDYVKMSKAMNEATEHIDSTFDKLSDWGSKSAKAFFSLENATLQLGIAFNRLMGDIKASMKFGSRTNFGGVMEDQWDALRSGMDPAAFTEMTAGARQASHQFRDAGDFSDKLIERQRLYYNYIGDTAEAAEFATNSFNLLGKAGIDPTSSAFNHLGDTFLYLNKAAGVTAEQFNGMMETMIADENIQVKLRAASESERRTIIAGIATRQKEMVAMGFSTEKSIEAGRAMGRIAGGDAKERFKQAAMAQMMLGNMGIEGGDKAAELIRKGQRMSADERTELQDIMGNASQFMAETKTGGIGTEIAFGTMMGKSGLDQYMGPNSPFNKTLEEQLAIDAEHNASIVKELKEGQGWLTDISYAVDIIKKGVMESVLVPAILGLTAAVGALALSNKVGGLGKLAGLLGRGGATGAVATGLGTAVTGAGIAAAAAVTGSVIAAGIGIWQGGQAVTTGRSDISDWMTGEGGTGAGNWISEKIGQALHFDGAALFGFSEEKAEEQALNVERVAKEAADQRIEQARIAAETLREQKRANELQELSMEFSQGLINQTQMRNRIQDLNSSYASTVPGT